MAEPTPSVPMLATTRGADGFSQATEAASSEETQPEPTGEATGTAPTTISVSTTQPPVNAATTGVVQNGNGTITMTSGSESSNTTVSGTSEPSVTPSEGAASGLRYDSLAVLAGLLVVFS